MTERGIQPNSDRENESTERSTQSNPDRENESTERGTKQIPIERERINAHGKEIPLALQFLIEVQ